MSLERSSAKGFHRIRARCLLTAAFLVLPLMARAQGAPVAGSTPPNEPKSSTPAVAPIREQRALDLLKRMSETLVAA
jgi:hypothetical protein